MGWGAGRKLHDVLDNTANVLAVEILCAVAGIEFRAPLRPGPRTRAVCDLIRQHVPPLEDDRPIGPDIETVAAVINSGALNRFLE